MDTDSTQQLKKKLDAMIGLLQNLLALELSRSGVPHNQICKRLHVTNKKVGQMLAGTKTKEKS